MNVTENTAHQIYQPQHITEAAAGHFKIDNSDVTNKTKKAKKKHEKIREQPTKDYPQDTLNSDHYSFTRDK
jgi:hypothetical protein